MRCLYGGGINPDGSISFSREELMASRTWVEKREKQKNGAEVQVAAFLSETFRKGEIVAMIAVNIYDQQGTPVVIQSGGLDLVTRSFFLNFAGLTTISCKAP